MITGTEDLERKASKELWGILGVNERVPGMSTHLGKAGQALNPWDFPQEWRVILMSKDAVDPFSLRKNQLVGLVKLVQQYFRGDSTCLFDAVGGGKTIQILALLAMLRANRIHKENTSSFLGEFSNVRSYIFRSNHS
jgi:hypothetical protein